MEDSRAERRVESSESEPEAEEGEGRGDFMNWRVGDREERGEGEAIIKLGEEEGGGGEEDKVEKVQVIEASRIMGSATNV